MIRFLILLAVLFAAALGFAWLKETPGELALTIGDTAYAVDLTTALIAFSVVVLVVVGIVWFVRELMRAPWRIAGGWRRRNVERGRAALSEGLIAIAAGDLRSAERAQHEAARRLPEQPLTLLLKAQTAQLKGDRVRARAIFQEMTEESATRIAGLRGLYIEAEREGEHLAARQIAERARSEAPTAPWAARALLRHQTAASDWDAALVTLTGAVDARIVDKRTARRQRAVILTAKAMSLEDGEPDAARAAALEAHDLANDLVPAAVAAGRLLSRQGDIRRAIRVLEAAWKTRPHPEIADAYLHVRTGDSAGDRLKRAETLFRLRPHADEGRHALARAAIDAREFSRAREILTPLLTERPTQKAFALMAELEEAESGDSGRARGWLARAVYAPRDAVWTADGIVLEEWTPVSPVTGTLDAVEWKVPIAELEGPKIEIDAAELLPPPPTAEDTVPDPADGSPDVPAAADGPVAPTGTVIVTVQHPPSAEAPARSPEAGAAASRQRATGADAKPLRATPARPSATPVPAEQPAPAGKAPPAAPRDRPPAEPPRPDDPGVVEDDDSEARELPAFLTRSDATARRSA
jgi:HemY protein